MSTEIESPQKKGNGPSRRTLLRTAAWSTPVIAMSVGAPPAMAASATCLPVGTLFNSTARGILLGGQILGVNLDNLVALGHALAQTPGTTTDALDTDPLDVTLLDAINLELKGLGTAVSDILTFVAPADTGVLSQYAKANENGNVFGAAGVVAENGAVFLNPTEAAERGPIATINLQRVLEEGVLKALPVVGELLEKILKLDLQVGAVYGRSQFNSRCVPPAEAGSPELQSGDLAFIRDYLLAYLRVHVESEVVGGLVTGLADAIQGIDVVGLLGAVVNPLLGGLGVLEINGSLTLNTADLAKKLIPPTDGHALQLDLDASEVILDLGAILGTATTGLNALPPNTLLFADRPIPTDAVATEGGTLLAALLDVLRDLVTLDLEIKLVGETIVDVTATVADLLDGTVTIDVLGLKVGALAGPLVSAILRGVTGLLDGLLTPGKQLYNTVFGNLNDLLALVFTVLKDVIRITINAQNDAPGSVPPPMQGIEPGRYDVAALHIGVVTGHVLDLFLARGSGGKNLQK